MQYGVNLPITVDAQTLAQLAAEAETAGWDGVFVWDCLYGNLMTLFEQYCPQGGESVST